MTANTTINIRAPKQARDLIDKAAKVLHRNRSEFVLEVAEERAREVLVDRTAFELSETGYRRFNQILEEPLPKKSAEALRRLLEHRAPWEK